MFDKTANGTEIIREDVNTNLDYTVALTRKTTKNGNVRHAVVITNNRTGIRTLIKSFLTLSPAFALYKNMLNA